MPAIPSLAKGRRLAGAAFVLLLVLSLGVVMIPLRLVRPFSPQTPEGLALSYALRQWAPLATLVAAVVALPLAALLWRNARRWGRVVIALASVALLGAAWQSRQNVYEEFFAPIEATRSAPASLALWVEENDPVLSVTLNGDAAAYPVRQIAYHHIVQDVVGGVPVAVTY